MEKRNMTSQLPLIFDNVTFSYEGKTVIENFSLELKAGEHVCLTGENGSGKSTLLKLADGLLAPNAGEIRVFGIPTTINNPIEFRKFTGLVMQNPANQIVHSRVIDDVEFGLKNLDMDKSLAQDALARLGAENLAQKLTHQLSGGEIELVAIAGVLAIQPKLLLLDEPTSMLDAEHKSQFIALLQNMQHEGVSILSSTHDVEFLKIATKTIEIS